MTDETVVLESPKILVTTNYDIFKSLNFNRDKSKEHINNIVKMLKKENLLHLHPIIVNEQMELIDGQHRLEAAKELNLPVYYIKSKVSYQHIINSQALNRKLSLDDAIKFYATKDRIPSYVEFRAYVEKLELSCKSLIGLLFGSVTKPIVEFIKDGKFELPKENSIIYLTTSSYKRFLDYAIEKRFAPLHAFKSARFTIGFRNLILMHGFDIELFFKKLDMRWFEIRPQITALDWTRHLINDIYNFRNQNPLTPPQND